MIATVKDNLSLALPSDIHSSQDPANIKDLKLNSNLLPGHIVIHHPKAGLNRLVDAASYLFSVIGKFKNVKHYHHFDKLQQKLIQEINTFVETIANQGYKAEYTIICRFILCATFDDIIHNAAWSQGHWKRYSLLTAFNQDLSHHDKFFNILERAIKEPDLYIDLMEFIYLCLSLGYKGHYRCTEHSQNQLEQITNNLYKHIRAFRGNVSKTLSPTVLNPPKTTIKPVVQSNLSILFIFFVTACIIMMLFVSLGYLMDVISNEAYKTISKIENHTTQQTTQS